MKPNELQTCLEIFHDLTSKPEAQLFWETPTALFDNSIQTPLDLHFIFHKLHKNQYASISDFLYDVEFCLTNFRDHSEKDSIRYFASMQLISDFCELTTPSELFVSPAILPLQEATRKMLQSSVLPEYPELYPISQQSSDQTTENDQSKNATDNQNAQTPSNEVQNSQPGSILFDNTPDPDDMTTLLRDIQFLTSAELTFKLAAFIHWAQPEIAYVSEDFSLNLELMTKKTRVGLRKYVTKLLRDAACGIFDPFNRPFGDSLTPVTVIQRGDPKNINKTPLLNI